jgi:SAM-dependent methyltransferase
MKNSINAFLEIIKIFIFSKISLIKSEQLKRCLICNDTEFIVFFSKYKYFLNLKIMKCNNCGMHFLNPRLNQRSLNFFYNNIYRGNFDLKNKNKIFERGRRRGKYIYEYILNNLKKNDIKSVFEIGCGYGGILDYFKEKNIRVVGSEKDQNIISFAKEKQLDIRNGELEVFDINEKCDLIILSHILEHIDNPKKFLKEIEKLLKPKGFIYIEVPGIENPKIIKRNYSIQVGHLYYFTKATLSNLFDNKEYNLVHSNDIIQMLVERRK